MRIFATAIVAACLTASAAVADFEARLFHYEWPQPVSIDAVLSIPQLRSAVNEFGESSDSLLIIRYPGGDAGNAWALEVRDTLVGLGIQSSDIVVEPASGEPDSIQIVVRLPRLPS